MGGGKWYVTEALTQEQVEIVASLRDMWAAQTSRTTLLDREAAVHAARQLYRTIGLAEPKIVWCESPLGILLANPFFDWVTVEEAARTPQVPLDEPVLDWLTRRFDASVKDADWAPVRTLGRKISFATFEDLYQRVTGAQLKIGKQFLGVARFPERRWSSIRGDGRNVEFARLWSAARCVDDVRSALGVWGRALYEPDATPAMTPEQRARSIVAPMRSAMRAYTRVSGGKIDDSDATIAALLANEGEALMWRDETARRYGGTPHHLYMFSTNESARFEASDWTKGCFDHCLAALTGVSLDDDLMAWTRLRLHTHWSLLTPTRCLLSDAPSSIHPVTRDDGEIEYCNFAYRDGWVTSDVAWRA